MDMNLDARRRRAEGYAAANDKGSYGKFDPVNSSFRWDIYLRPEYRKSRRKFISGYSKGIDTPENEDLTYVLDSRLLKNVWLQNEYCKKSERIEVFENVAGQRGRHIFTLYPDDFQDVGGIADTELEDKLIQCYQLMRKLQDRDKPLRDMFKRKKPTSANPRATVPKTPKPPEVSVDDLITSAKRASDPREHARIIEKMRKRNCATGLIQSLKREFKERTTPAEGKNAAPVF